MMEAVGTFLIVFGSHEHVLFIITVEILMLINIGNRIRHDIVYLIFWSSNEHLIKTNGRSFKCMQSQGAMHTKNEGENPSIPK